MSLKILIFSQDNEFLYKLNAQLSRDFQVTGAIVENSPSKLSIIKRRAKRLGLLRVINQVIFIIYSKILCLFSKDRVDEILSNIKDNRDIKIYRVDSINSDKTKSLLKELQFDVIVLNGTRIISGDILNSTNATILNIHFGITPKYRGVHGGYWALANQDEQNCGVSIHIVDSGIDTGAIIYQDRIYPKRGDNFCTYPYLQFVTGLKLLIKALRDIQNNQLKIKKSNLDSKLWYHPTMVEYIKNYIKYGVK